MGLIKNICARIAFNKQQRLVIWNALAYSDFSYRRKGNVDRAVLTSTIMAQTERQFGIAGKKFTKEEVNAMLEEYGRRVKANRQEELDEAYQSGREDAIREMLSNLEHGRGIMVGEVVEVEEEPTSEKQENAPTAEGEGTSAPTEAEEMQEEQKQDAGEQPAGEE